MYLVLDCETGCNEVYKRKGNPWFNKILCVGLKYQKPILRGLASPNNLYVFQHLESGIYNDVTVLVGHNIKYDLLYLWKEPELQTFFKVGGTIWDTQLAEYILSGQRHKYPALRDIAVNKYGCPEREKHLETAFSNGLTTETMDINLLLEDVKYDILDTEQIMLQQVKKAKELGMYHLIRLQMDSLLATTEMEYNGIAINKDILETNKNELKEKCSILHAEVQEIILKHWPANIEFNPNSTHDLSKLFFGGSIKYKERRPMLNALGEKLLYKTGPNRGKVKEKFFDAGLEFKGLGARPLAEFKTKREGIYKTDDTMLNLLATKEDHVAGKVAKRMIEIRALEKEISTYYEATELFIYDIDGCVHGELSHCGYDRGSSETGGGTNTGRLSSRNPNLQNQPRG